MSHTDPYRPGCPRCGYLYTPERCVKCNAASYCSVECKDLDTSEHRPGCGAVARARVKYEAELEQFQGSYWFPVLKDPSNQEYIPIPGVDSATFDKLRFTRHSLIIALQHVRSRQAAEERLQLLRSDLLVFGTLNYRGGSYAGWEENFKLALGLFLRLGHDVACYQFMAQWNARDSAKRGDFSLLGALNPDNMNLLDDSKCLLFQEVPGDSSYYSRHLSDQVSLITAAILKFKVLQDLKNLPIMRGPVGLTVAQDMLSDLTEGVLSKLTSKEDIEKAIEALTDQIGNLFGAVETALGRGFLGSGKVSRDRFPSMFQMFEKGMRFRMLVSDAFANIPDAETHFKEILDKSDKKLSLKRSRHPYDIDGSAKGYLDGY